jgi:hypothetical protein
MQEWPMSTIMDHFPKMLGPSPDALSRYFGGEKHPPLDLNQNSGGEGLKVPCQDQPPEMAPRSLPFDPPWKMELVQVALALGLFGLFLAVSERLRETACAWRGRPASKKSSSTDDLQCLVVLFRSLASPTGLFAPVFDALTKLGGKLRKHPSRPPRARDGTA